MSDKSTKPSFSEAIPHDDDRVRRICDHCGFVDYVNPKIVVGSVAQAEDGKVLMCRRAIEPRRGFWTLPAGFLEAGEDPAAGALREAREEACAELEILGLLGVYSVPRISQVQLFFRARLVSAIAVGPESAEVALFDWDDIPWADIAFPTVTEALQHWREPPPDGATPVQVMTGPPLY